jgi:hypothetical protein
MGIFDSFSGKGFGCVASLPSWMQELEGWLRQHAALAQHGTKTARCHTGS